MGKKGGGAKKLESASHTAISLREEATGKIQSQATSNTKSKLRCEHLKNLAQWATTNDPLIPSLAAFYGRQYATFGEATGVPPDPSLMTCQRCETVLQPGFNTTVRIEKNKSKVRHKRKSSDNITQNNIVYKCHFCLHQNRKRGTPKEHIKGSCPSKDKSMFESTPSSKNIKSNDHTLEDCLATPSSKNTTTLLEGKKRRRESSLTKNAIKTTDTSAKEMAKSASTTSKRRRKSWTSLKEIAQNNELKNSHIANLTIPFSL
ncbi:hypothetical protein Fmac_002035 [Flemingia macrophylla]|uniref:Uncharacterized protein n=1 Tax=Flemingia macrophylla TaxID=520843 RepID=A0ABD1NLL0_9FABA